MVQHLDILEEVEVVPLISDPVAASDRWSVIAEARRRVSAYNLRPPQKPVTCVAKRVQGGISRACRRMAAYRYSCHTSDYISRDGARSTFSIEA